MFSLTKTSDKIAKIQQKLNLVQNLVSEKKIGWTPKIGSVFDDKVVFPFLFFEIYFAEFWSFHTFVVELIDCKMQTKNLNMIRSILS